MTGTETRTDRLTWVHEEDPRWDDDRERVFSTVPATVFPSVARTPGDRLSSDWWRVERDGSVLGYGWLDDVWGDAEILLAVDAEARGAGVGAFIVARLEDEAAARGLNYVLNVVRDTHPDRDAVAAWLEARGFTPAEDGRLRKRVAGPGRDIGQRQSGRPGAGPARRPDQAGQARYEAERERAEGRPHAADDGKGGEPMGPGNEEGGGYVDPESHRY
jgi:N-acetylglutamate synthase-like GNAT family acetyltransferase